MLPSYALATIPLALAPLSLLLAALVHALFGKRDAPPRGHAPASVLVSTAVAAIALAAAAPLALGGKTVLDGLSFVVPPQTPAETPSTMERIAAFFAEGVRIARIGSLDARIGFVADAVSIGGGVAVLLAVGLFAHAHAGRGADRRTVAATLVTGAGGLMAALGEGFPTVFFGLAIAFWSTRLFLVRRPSQKGFGDAPAFGAFGVSLVCLTLTVAGVFWALGGRWLDDTRYLADYRARFVVAGASDPAKGAPVLLKSPNARGTITITSHPGALVYLGVADESHLSQELPFGRTPMVARSLPAGLHKVAIDPGGGAIIAGDGLEVALVDTLAIREGQDTRIALVGPTMTFHELAPQLDTGSELASRRMGTSKVGTWLGLTVALGLAAFVASMRGALAGADNRAHAGIGCVAVAFAVLVARLGPIASVTPWAAALGALAIGAVAVHAALTSRCLIAPAFGMLALAGLAGAGNAALGAAVSIAFGLVALSTGSRSVAVVEAPAETSAPAKKKKKSSKAKRAAEAKDAVVDEEATAKAPTASPATPRDLWLVFVAVAALPVPLFGPYAAFAAAFARPLFEGFWGATIAVAALATWVALGRSAGHLLARSFAPTTLGAGAAVVATLAGLGVTLWLDPSGSKVAFVVGLVPFAAAVVSMFRARMEATREPSKKDEDAPTHVAPVAARALALVDAVLSFPLSWIDVVVRPRAAAPAPARGDDE